MKTLLLVAVLSVSAFSVGCSKKSPPADAKPAAAMPGCCKMAGGTHTCEMGEASGCCAAHAAK